MPIGGGKRRRAWFVLAALLLVAAVEARLFVFPPSDTPVPTDAIVVFNGPGERTAYAWELADASGLAQTVVVSIGDTDRCEYRRPWLEENCLTPDPPTTRGEARAFAQLAREEGWESLLVVSTDSQSVRARLRLGRCYDGTTRFVTIREDFFTQIYRVLYENGALLKALVFERDC